MINGSRQESKRLVEGARDENETTVRRAKHGRRLKEMAKETKGLKGGRRRVSKMAEDREEDTANDDGCIAGGSAVRSVECGVEVG